MPLRSRLLPPLLLMLVLVPAPHGSAHHGPPHDEIDEFDEVVPRLAVPGPLLRWSWPALVMSVAGVATAFALSRKHRVGESRVRVWR